MDQYNKIIDEIDEALGVEQSDIPYDKAINSTMYSEDRGLSRGWACCLLRQGWMDGHLERAKDNKNTFWYWPK